MTNDAQEYNIAAIRQLLLVAFNPEDLRRFYYDRRTFRPIVDLFGPGLGFTDMVDRALEYCDRHALLDQLLAEVKQVNPGQYARFESALRPAHLGQHTHETSAQGTPQRPTPPSAPAKVVDSPQKPALSQPTAETLTIDSPICLQLVRVPAGKFQMGSIMARDKHALDDELPPHPVHLPEFHISRCSLTNIQYQAFVRASGHRAPDHWERGRIPGGKSNHPVVNISWTDALAFCAWLAQESGQPIRLPTEAEWEKAARGTDGRIYPWGDEPPDDRRCNFDANVDTTTPVGQYSPLNPLAPPVSFIGCPGPRARNKEM